jgi:hypothetical protein
MFDPETDALGDFPCTVESLAQSGWNDRDMVGRNVQGEREENL